MDSSTSTAPGVIRETLQQVEAVDVDRIPYLGHDVPTLPPGLDRRFEAIVFDWDGTAVADRAADACALKARVEALSAAAVDVVIVSGTHLGNVDAQLAARPLGPGELHLCLNRGSEAYRVDRSGAHLVWRRVASAEEDRRLTDAAERAVAQLAEHGLAAEVVSARLNRRKIDLIPVEAWADPPKARIAELVHAVETRLAGAGIDSLRAAVEIAEAAARDAGLPEARVTTDGKHVEIGLTDKSDAAGWAFRHLDGRGIGSGLVLIAGDEFGPLGGRRGSDSLMLVPGAARATPVSVGVEPGDVPRGVVHLPGGPDSFLRLLDDQLRRRAERTLPEIDPDPGWTVVIDGFDVETERAHGSLLNLADGSIGTAGAPIDDDPATSPRVLAGGIYVGDGPATELAAAPLWDRSGLRLARRARLRRTLDLRTGVLVEETAHLRSVRRAVRFTCLRRPGTVALRIDAHPRLSPVSPPLRGASDSATTEAGIVDGHQSMSVAAGRGGIVVSGREARVTALGRTRVDRLAVYRADPDEAPAIADSARALATAGAAGFDRLLLEQRAGWASRWAEADIRIEGDDELQHAVRFALFHLMASVKDVGEAAVGARGISGPAYRGHVFWDSDVFILPFFAATHPAAARAMLEYRVRRLAAARDAAAGLGRAGARFPWESAVSGADVTPPAFVDHTGTEVAIRTGALEEHIVADVAWAADAYVSWTGDADFAAGPARTMTRETARYWSSRIEHGDDGRAHIRGVMGPDEYHDVVDDNAFTNVMARWNLRRAALAADAPADERQRWRDLATRLVDGYDPRTRLYEQFAGFYRLEPLVIREIVGRRPVAADLLLGRARVQGAQVVKQADVLMLHHLVPHAVAAGSLEPNLEFYEPRTAHGSSLSPGIHAGLLARAGRLTDAVELLRLTARIDLDDLTRTTAGGLHVAAMGSLWQALVYGFAGLRPGRRTLWMDPRLPPGWTALEIPIQYHHVHLRIRLLPGTLVVEADRPVPIRLPGGRPTRARAGFTRFEERRGRWQEIRP